MHPRFEIRLLTDTIVGECPPVTILRIAWEDKRDYLADWMLAYFRQHGFLPRGCHQPGKTPRHGLELGTVDFDAARGRLLCEFERRRFMDHLLPYLRRLLTDSFARRIARWVAALLVRRRMPPVARC